MSKNFSKKNEDPEAEMPPPGRFFAPSGSRFGSPRCPGNGDVRKSCKSERKIPLSGWKAVFLWLRGLDLNQRPPGYELPSVSPSAAPQCFPDFFEPEIAQNPKVGPLRSTSIFPVLGQNLGLKKVCLTSFIRIIWSKVFPILPPHHAAGDNGQPRG